MSRISENLLSQLEQEHIPLDSALVHAIAADYDVADPVQLTTLREHLDLLRASALADDAAEFDPSGTSGHERDLHADAQRFSSDRSTEVFSDDTDLTSLSNKLSQIEIVSTASGDVDVGTDENLNDIEVQDAATKQARLAELFPHQKPADIAFVLKKSDGSFSRAMDSLLNYVFFECADREGREYRAPLRGIDAFSDQYLAPPSKRKRTKNKKYRPQSEADAEYASPTSPNRWASAKADIEFIADKAKMPEQAASSIYHENGASLPRALRDILEREHAKCGKSIEDCLFEEGVVDLLDEFPTIPAHHVAAILRITRPSAADAHTMAKALLSPSSSGTHNRMKLTPQYAPYRQEDDVPSPQSMPGSGSSTPLTNAASELAIARETAFGKASQYHRKGNSANLLGAAAAYYSQVGRDYDLALKVATAAEADALVASNSSATVLDLHGVSVKDATRIANERVRAWWDGLGEGRIRGPKSTVGSGYRIVTGVGRHSDGGVGKIGPAVARMLVRDGWKVEIGSGELLVTGIARKQ